MAMEACVVWQPPTAPASSRPAMGASSRVQSDSSTRQHHAPGPQADWRLPRPVPHCASWAECLVHLSSRSHSRAIPGSDTSRRCPGRLESCSAFGAFCFGHARPYCYVRPNPAVHRQPSPPLLCPAQPSPALPLFPRPHALFTFVPANTTLHTDPRSLLSLVSSSALFKSLPQPADYPLEYNFSAAAMLLHTSWGALPALLILALSRFCKSASRLHATMPFGARER